MKTMIFIALILAVAPAWGQCKKDARKAEKEYMAPYDHDGIYNSTLLEPGESIRLQKTLYGTKDYRFVITNPGGNQMMEIELRDENSALIYKVVSVNKTEVIDYLPEKSGKYQLFVEYGSV